MIQDFNLGGAVFVIQFQWFVALDLKFKLKNIPTGKDVQERDLHSTAGKTDDLLFDWIPADIPVNLVRI